MLVSSDFSLDKVGTPLTEFAITNSLVAEKSVSFELFCETLQGIFPILVYQNVY